MLLSSMQEHLGRATSVELGVSRCITRSTLALMSHRKLILAVSI